MPEALQLSAELRALLDAKLDTLEKLEIALTLRAAEGFSMPIADLARHLQVGTDVLRHVAADVARAGLVSIDNDTVRLTFEEGKMPLLDEAKVVHDQHRHELNRMFSLIALDRIRRMGVRTFADAFQFRKKKKKDTDNG